jgi:BMFP domain-containing protein YqiC
MNQTVMREEFERLEQTVNRVFARVSSLEARVRELESELATARDAVRPVDRPRLVDALRRTA